MVTITCFKNTEFTGFMVCKALCDIFCPISQELWVEIVCKMLGMSGI